MDYEAKPGKRFEVHATPSCGTGTIGFFGKEGFRKLRLRLQLEQPLREPRLPQLLQV